MVGWGVQFIFSWIHLGTGLHKIYVPYDTGNERKENSWLENGGSCWQVVVYFITAAEKQLLP